LCSHSRVSQYFMESEGSLPRSQELSTCTYPEPDQSRPTHPIRIVEIDTRCIIMLSTHLRLGLPSCFFPLALLPITYTPSLLPQSCHMPRPPHPPRLYNSNYTWRRIPIMQLLVVLFCSSSRHRIPFRSKYPPQHSVLKHHQPMFLP
jgi:hypothetical protein